MCQNAIYNFYHLPKPDLGKLQAKFELEHVEIGLKNMRETEKKYGNRQNKGHIAKLSA